MKIVTIDVTLTLTTSTPCMATAITALHASIAMFIFYRTMNPLFLIDMKEFTTKETFHPHWNSNSNANSTPNSEANASENKEDYHQIKACS